MASIQAAESANRSAGPRAARIAFVTIGQAPRDDIVPELLTLLGLGPGDADCTQFGALDGLTEQDLAAIAPGPREGRLHTRLADGRFVVVGSGLVARRLEPLMRELDGRGYDLIVLATTGVFQSITLRTPFVHGQQALDAWIEALMMGDCELGLIYPLAQQHRGFAHGTLVQRARAVDATGDTDRLDQAASQLARAALILMHSVGYTEAMAHQVAAQTGKPVVTARRIIAGAIRLRLANRGGGPPVMQGAPIPGAAGLGDGAGQLTPRERDVLAAMLDGASNKAIGLSLGISHRTVEIHRGRVLAKLNASSPAELMRRAMMARRNGENPGAVPATKAETD